MRTWGCASVRAWRVRALIFMKCYLRHLICHSLVNVQRSVSLDVCCHRPPTTTALPHPLPLSASRHSFSAAESHTLIFPPRLSTLHQRPSLRPPRCHSPMLGLILELPPRIPGIQQLEMPSQEGEHRLVDVLHRALGFAPPGERERWAGEAGRWR